eukprot:13823571-Ditylum_brightwellii.AAC.1
MLPIRNGDVSNWDAVIPGRGNTTASVLESVSAQVRNKKVPSSTYKDFSKSLGLPDLAVGKYQNLGI